MSSEVSFKINKNNKLGRHAVASRFLESGDLIVTETPFAYGPKSGSTPLCLGCFTPVDCTILCSKCLWPICSLDCKSLSTHEENECKVFADARIKFQEVEDPSEVCLQYESITPLRVLLGKEKYPERWQEVEILEAHNEIRKTKPIWHFNQVNVVDYLRGVCKLDERFSEDLIHNVCGILEVNSFEARASSGHLIRCLYPKLSLFAHDCVSNIHHTIAPDNFKVTVRAAVDIPENGVIFCSYTYSLWPTLVRREFLLQSKYFECECKRCRDKTELDTHLGTLKCSKCDNGTILSTDPLSFNCEWKCTHCEFKTNSVLVKKVYNLVQNEIKAVEMITGAEGIECRESLYL